jgi:hypothetical protein
MPFASCEIIVFCNEAAAAAARRRRLRGATRDLIVVPIKRSSVNAALAFVSNCLHSISFAAATTVRAHFFRFCLRRREKGLNFTKP